MDIVINKNQLTLQDGFVKQIEKYWWQQSSQLTLSSNFQTKHQFYYIQH